MLSRSLIIYEMFEVINYLRDLIKPYKHKLPWLLSSYKANRAMWWARNARRTDIVAAQVAAVMHSTGNIFKDKVVLEIGSGWVLSHAIVFYLLGAKKIICTDLYRLAKPNALSVAVRSADASLIRDVLANFEDYNLIRERWDRLLSIKEWSFGSLADIGIEYVAPLDVLKSDGLSADVVFSQSVLEHIKVEQVQDFAEKLHSLGRSQFHLIHLEDHYHSVDNPFGFLALDSYPSELQLERGNRVRASEWIKLFPSGKIIRKIVRDKPLSGVSKSISFTDEIDLRTSHLWIHVGCVDE